MIGISLGTTSINKRISSLIKILYRSSMGLVAKRGTIAWTGTPTINANGVTPGHGPSFSDVIAWENGGTLTVKFKALVASDHASLATPLQFFGPVYLGQGVLQAKDGTNTAIYATTWEAGDVITVAIEVFGDGDMRVGRR